MENSASGPSEAIKEMEEIDSVSRVHTTSERYWFEIEHFSRVKDQRGIGEFIKSMPFSFGGYEWKLKFYPHGTGVNNSAFISIFLDFLSTSGEPRIKFSFSLLDYVTREATYTITSRTPTFSSNSTSWGCLKFLEMEILEASNCLDEDSLTIICDITVIREPVTYNYPPFTIPESPSNIHARLRGLLSSKKGVDINIEVGDKRFHAHKIVLAASSPVFEAQIFGHTIEAKENKITITDMEAPVFEAMLHFIYTDTLLPIDKHAVTAITQHLLVAADRYMLDRLRIICEQILCRSIDASNVSTTLALAEQCNFAHLKSECLRHLTSKEALRSAMKTDGFEHLLRSCPSVVTEIINKMF